MWTDKNVVNKAAHAQTHSTVGKCAQVYDGICCATAVMYARSKPDSISRIPYHDVSVSGPNVEVLASPRVIEWSAMWQQCGPISRRRVMLIMQMAVKIWLQQFLVSAINAPALHNFSQC
jgi:hypothetical protein